MPAKLKQKIKTGGRKGRGGMQKSKYKVQKRNAAV
jgi:hypothetical protein